MDDESEWMTYADAIASLQKKGVGYVDANEYLTRRAAAGLIDTRASLMIDGEGWHAVRSENAPVPAEFWQAFLGGQNLANHPQHGDFSAGLPKPHPRRIVQLFDVRVERGKVPTIDAPKPRAAPLMSKSSALKECEAWLRAEFADPNKAVWTKPRFREAAQSRWGERLSQRGFDKAWTNPAAEFGRDKGGPKVIP